MSLKNKERARLALAELEKEMELLTKEQMNACKGGGSGTQADPYTWSEYESLMDNPNFVGGWVMDSGNLFWGVGGVTVTGGGSGNIQPPFENNNGISGFVSQAQQNFDLWWQQAREQARNPQYNYGGSSGYFDANSLDNTQGYYQNFNGSTGYYDNDGYQNYGGGGGGYTQPNPIKDGIDITNSKHFTFNTSTNAVFDRQLKDILATNKTIKGLLSYFDKGYVHLTFGIKDIVSKEGYVISAHMSPIAESSFHINFNAQLINENGWSLNNVGIDNIGYDFSKARTSEERLVITLTHEAIHAKHYAAFNDVFRIYNNLSDTYEHLLRNGYSQEFVDAFITKNERGQWQKRADSEIIDLLHRYMEKYDHGVIDKVLEEYRKDRGL